MQDYVCIRKWLATELQTRGPGLISSQSSRCWMKNLQKCLGSCRYSDSTICCKKMELTAKSPLDSRTNEKKSDHIYIATKPVALTKRHVVTDKFISPHTNWPEG